MWELRGDELTRLATVLTEGPATVAVVHALGAAALAVPALRRGRVRPAELGRAVAVPFLAFVAALG